MSARVTICGLGPGGPGRLTESTRAALDADGPRFVRTARHPTADLIAGAEAFDPVYERAESFDEVYRTIADTVVAAARERGRALYAVPGSPLVLERSVRWIRDAGAAADDVEVEVLPAVSFLDDAWARLGVDPVDAGVRLVDGLAFTDHAAGERGPLLVAHVHSQWVLSDIKLAVDAGPEQRAIVLQGLGTDDEQVFEVAWPDLDRAVEADHLTTLYLPELAAPVAAELMGSIEMMHRLRQECPWDREQDHGTLRPFLVEEAYEVLDALDAVVEQERAVAEVDGPDGYVDLEEELGDLWFQILFHAELAAEAGAFTIADVARGLTEKMVRRHPHVYGRGGEVSVGDGVDGDDPVGGPADWDRLKQQEKERGSVLDGIPTALPALAKAQKTLRKAEGAGHPADQASLRASLQELLALEPGAEAGAREGGGQALLVQALLGQALLGLVDIARRLDIDAETALRDTLDRAADRFRSIERDSTPSVGWVAG